jgi:hypothetical protein
MSVESPVPCRLWVIMARKAQCALILRRGPTRWLELILWDTKKDSFQRGQWFHGRIYEERCDLSPDGSKFIYMAGKYGRKRDADMPDTWTAISKPPYITALALWRTYGVYGGGLFLDDRCFRRTDWPEKIHPRFSLKGLVDVLDDFDRISKHRNFFAAEEHFKDPVDLRLRRVGWEVVEQAGRQPLKWMRGNPDGRGKLLLDRSSRTPKYVLVLGSRDGEPQALDAEWADWDQRGRLAVVRRGKLLVGKWNRHKGVYFEELADFNDDCPVSIEAPEWAKHW